MDSQVIFFSGDELIAEELCDFLMEFHPIEAIIKVIIALQRGNGLEMGWKNLSMNESLHPYQVCFATSEEAEMLNEKIRLFNSEQLSLHGKVEESRDYVIKDKESIIAGIRICFYLNACMFIRVLFVDELHRGKGLGTWLLRHVEKEAKSRSIRLSHLDTFDFQAQDFYVKLGYEIFGILLDDCPKGHKRFYLKKILQ